MLEEGSISDYYKTWPELAIIPHTSRSAEST